MTVNLSATLPFAPYQTNTSNVIGPDPSGANVSTAVPRFEESLRQATESFRPDSVQYAQLATTPAPGAVVTTDAVPQSTATQGVPPVNETGESAVADARTRAAEGLSLERPNATTGVENSGTSILNGLEQLRSVFDKQYSSVGGQIEGTRMDVGEMMALQAEVVKYSVLVDVSSKLAGKSTQAMDSLMKGQ